MSLNPQSSPQLLVLQLYSTTIATLWGVHVCVCARMCDAHTQGTDNPFVALITRFSSPVQATGESEHTALRRSIRPCVWSDTLP